MFASKSIAALLSVTLAHSAVAEGVWLESPVQPQQVSQLSPAAVEAVAVSLDGGPVAIGQSWRLPATVSTQQWRTTALIGSADTDFRWQGVAEDATQSQALIVRRGDALSGMISTAEGVFELVPTAAGNFLVKLESARFPACAGGEDPGLPQATVPGAEARNRGTTVTIDVLVVYTPEARDAAGGVNGIESVAQAAVDNANLAFSNGLSTARLRLVDARLANYNDSGNSSSDLTWVRNDAEVAAWRDEVGADMVGLIANNIGGSCGRGYVMRNPGPGFAGSAFQVTARGCAVGNLSYAHEHGHNMGMEHDPANGTSPGSASFPYAFGHFVSGSYRTVMSYSSECTGGCTRRPYFSNPEVSFMGAPTGITDERENAQVATNVAEIVAAFRADAGLLFDDGFE